MIENKPIFIDSLIPDFRSDLKGYLSKSGAVVELPNNCKFFIVWR